MDEILKIKRFPRKDGKNADMPRYATAGSAGLDLAAFISEPVTVYAGKQEIIPTGIGIEIPLDFVGLVFARSGLAMKSGISLSNGVGVIDSDFRGEIKVGLFNHSDQDFVVNSGDRIAQLVLMPVLLSKIVETEVLSETDRGEGGFGSTGL